MSGIDPQILFTIGIEESQYDFPLPEFVKFQMTPHQSNGLCLYHSQPRPASEQMLIRLIYQIVDMPKFLG